MLNGCMACHSRTPGAVTRVPWGHIKHNGQINVKKNGIKSAAIQDPWFATKSDLACVLQKPPPTLDNIIMMSLPEKGCCLVGK